MSRRVGLLAGLLVLTLGSGVVAQEPSPEPPPWFGGRVEMPEHGFAVTLPDDWVAFDPSADVYEQARRALEAERGPEVSEEEILTVALLLDDVRRNERQLAVFTKSWSGCGVTVVPDTHIDLDVGAAELRALISSQEGVVEVGVPEVLELHAGPARLVRYRSPDGSEMGTYIGDGSDATFIIACGGASDDWLSIAETFEFLPAEG